MPSFDWTGNVCFVCGSIAGGLHVRFSGDSGEVTATTVINPPHQGFAGIVHGGILASMVDDAMWHVIHQQDNDFPVTAELKIRYLQPARIGEALTVRGRLVSYRRRLMAASATIENSRGQLVVQAAGRFMPLADHEPRDI